MREINFGRLRGRLPGKNEWLTPELKGEITEDGRELESKFPTQQTENFTALASIVASVQRFPFVSYCHISRKSISIFAQAGLKGVLSHPVFLAIICKKAI